jgi:hypothetical protein
MATPWCSASAGLAQQIVAREPLLDAHGEVNRQTLKSLFDRLMTFNPSVELYLLSPDGDLLADAAPPGHIQRQRIDMAPVQVFSPAVRRRCMATIRAALTDEKSSAPPAARRRPAARLPVYHFAGGDL